jgi:hypothetical protein
MPSHFFQNGEQRQRFLDALRAHDQIWGEQQIDQYWGPALLILTADVGVWKQASAYIKGRAIAFQRMRKEVDQSSGLRVLLEYAAQLFTGQGRVDLIDLRHLDSKDFRLVLGALELSYRSWRIDEL